MNRIVKQPNLCMARERDYLADYKRFVSYMYVYTNGIKRKNVGYARVEVRNGECRFKIYMQMEGVSEGIFPTYLIYRPTGDMELVYIGDCMAKNQLMDGRLTVDENNVMGSGYKFLDMGGILLFLDTGVFYATQWDDKPVILDEVLQALKQKPKRATGIEPKKSGGIPVSEPEKPPFAGEAALADSKKDKENNFDVIKTYTDEKLHTDKQPDTAKPDSAKPAAAAVAEGQSTETLSVNTKTDEKREIQNDKKGYAENQADTATAVSGKKEGGEMTSAADNKADTEEELIAVESSVVRQDDGSAEALTDRQTDTGTMTYTEKRDSSEDKTSAYRPAEEKAHSDEGINTKGTAAVNRTIVDNRDDQKSIREERKTEMPIYMLPRGFKTKEGTKPYHTDKPINPWEQVDRYRRFEKEKNITSDQLQKDKERPAGTEMPKENQTNQAVEKIFNTFPRIYPFEDNEIKRCVKIEPKDIGTLPASTWILSNNSFLLHGYYCYHHLIFAEIIDRYGCRYIVGVPGIYHNRERFMARMFGFENFKSIRKRDLKQGDFGYWYREVEI